VDSAMFYRSQQRCHERAGINAALFHEVKPRLIRETGAQIAKLSFAQFGSHGSVPKLLRANDCALIAQVNAPSRLVFHFMDEFGKHLQALYRKRPKRACQMAAKRGKYAGGRLRRFASWLTALDDEDLSTTLVQFARQRHPDDAAANDDYVPRLHNIILSPGATELRSVGTGTLIGGRLR
jgi:hypothetical protein